MACTSCATAQIRCVIYGRETDGVTPNLSHARRNGLDQAKLENAYPATASQWRSLTRLMKSPQREHSLRDAEDNPEQSTALCSDAPLLSQANLQSLRPRALKEAPVAGMRLSALPSTYDAHIWELRSHVRAAIIWGPIYTTATLFEQG